MASTTQVHWSLCGHLAMMCRPLCSLPIWPLRHVLLKFDRRPKACFFVRRRRRPVAGRRHQVQEANRRGALLDVPPPTLRALANTHTVAMVFAGVILATVRHPDCIFVDTRKRLVQLPNAGSPPRRATAPHRPQFRLPVIREDEVRHKGYTKNKQHRVNPNERSARSLPISDQRNNSLQRCPDPCESEHLNSFARRESPCHVPLRLTSHYMYYTADQGT